MGSKRPHLFPDGIALSPGVLVFLNTGYGIPWAGLSDRGSLGPKSDLGEREIGILSWTKYAVVKHREDELWILSRETTVILLDLHMFLLTRHIWLLAYGQVDEGAEIDPTPKMQPTYILDIAPFHLLRQCLTSFISSSFFLNPILCSPVIIISIWWNAVQEPE